MKDARLKNVVMKVPRDKMKKFMITLTSGVRNMKSAEIYLQDAIERSIDHYVDDPTDEVFVWWEVTSVSIFMDLLSGKTILEVIDAILSDLYET